MLELTVIFVGIIALLLLVLLGSFAIGERIMKRVYRRRAEQILQECRERFGDEAVIDTIDP